MITKNVNDTSNMMLLVFDQVISTYQGERPSQAVASDPQVLVMPLVQ